MADPQHVELIRQGASKWNEWKRQQDFGYVMDLSGADLSGLKLREASFLYADLTGCNLRAADLHSCNFDSAKLIHADLSEANAVGANFAASDLTEATFFETMAYGCWFTLAKLRQASIKRSMFGPSHFFGTDFTGADLSESDLQSAYLARCLVAGANFSNCELGGTVFASLDLSGVKGLDTCRHKGPSVLDHETLQQSGVLPLPFLRGCGLPDRLIDYLPSLLGQAVQFHSCYIAYAVEDGDFAARLHADLQGRGIRCWFSPHDVRGGRKLFDQIDEGIRLFDRLLLILSDASVSSGWVKIEIGRAREKERKLRTQVLFPISLVPFEALRNWRLLDADNAEFTDREIREFYIPDFTNWKDHRSYDAAFERLCQDLRAG